MRAGPAPALAQRTLAEILRGVPGPMQLVARREVQLQVLQGLIEPAASQLALLLQSVDVEAFHDAVFNVCQLTFVPLPTRCCGADASQKDLATGSERGLLARG